MYFWFAGSAGALFPFLPVLFDSLGLSPGEIGVLGAVSPLVAFVAAPLWGAVADKWHAHYRVLVMSMVLGVALRMLMNGAVSFSSMLLLVLGSQFVSAPAQSLVDNAILDLLGTRTALYGRQRLWGAVGFGVCALVVGLLQERMGYAAAFLVHGLCMLVAVAVSRQLAMHAHEGARVLVCHGLGAMFRRPEVVVFFIVVFVAGAATGVIENFLYVHVAHLGGDSTVMGVARFTTCMAELPFFYYSGELLERLGVGGVLTLGLATYAVRLGYYAVLRSPWLVVPSEVLHGITYAAMWSACTAFAHAAAPPGLGATVQGLLAGVHFGLGMSAGALAGGWLYASRGGTVLFAGAAVAMTVALLLFGAVQLRARWQGRDAMQLQAGAATAHEPQPAHQRLEEAVATAAEAEDGGGETDSDLADAPQAVAVAGGELELVVFDAQDDTSCGSVHLLTGAPSDRDIAVKVEAQ